MSIARELAELGGSYGSGGFVGMKNRIINGAMVIDQRNAGASVTLNSSASFPVDRFGCYRSSASVVATAQQSSVAPNNFIKSLLYSVTTGAAIGSSEYNEIQHRIEGHNFADFGFGTAAAQSVSVSFWARSSITGTYGFVLSNNNSTRNFAATYVINSANTWEYKTIQIPGDTSGTWATDNTLSAILKWDMGVGSAVSGSVTGAWSTTGIDGVTGTVKLCTTTGATFYITGVQLEKGSTATSFDYRPYGTELQLCQRYFYQITREVQYQRIGYCLGQVNFAVPTIHHPVKMRAAPSAITYQSATDFTYEKGDSSASYALTSLSLAQSSTYSLQLSGAMVGTGGGLGVCWFNANANAYLGISAEL